MLQGARPVGKTWLLKHFGATEFNNVAYFNFEEQPDLKQFFENTKDIQRIVQNLSMVHGLPIEPQKTPIIFDEIQECNEALNTLKYFYENAPEYAVASARSLLSVAMSKGNSFPVRKSFTCLPVLNLFLHSKFVRLIIQCIGQGKSWYLSQPQPVFLTANP